MTNEFYRNIVYLGHLSLSRLPQKSKSALVAQPFEEEKRKNREREEEGVHVIEKKGNALS